MVNNHEIEKGIQLADQMKCSLGGDYVTNLGDHLPPAKIESLKNMLTKQIVKNLKPILCEEKTSLQEKYCKIQIENEEFKKSNFFDKKKEFLCSEQFDMIAFYFCAPGGDNFEALKEYVVGENLESILEMAIEMTEMEENENNEEKIICTSKGLKFE